ncbi:hypothetical protein Q428_05645 [Fervidicella metallireducens AeB]|uniref:Diguanylate cyclase n=1 Tax=Fervidicella metallireducens AeB TaxID=1403537 RepID=A0A017RVU3_9CLOT|nr:diguanylate cyclase [Fervidicella metallireducens]EYE88898.1 hypothetical protein Q428_05645 [Fervidicella metallireducens AeB]
MLKDIFADIAIIIGFLLITGQTLKNIPLGGTLEKKEQLYIGLICGLMGHLLIVYAIEITDTVNIDLRNFAVVISGILGGEISVIITSIIIGIFNFTIYGFNNSSILSFLTLLTVGLGCLFIVKRKYSRHRQYIFMLLFTSFISATTYLKNIHGNYFIYAVYSLGILAFTGILVHLTLENIFTLNNNFKLMDYYRIMTDNLSDMVSTFKPNGEYLYISPITLNVLGYTKEEIIGRSIYEFIHQDDVIALKKIHLNLLKGQEILTKIYRIKRKDGSYVLVETSFKNIRNRNGELQEIIAVTRDITKRRQIEMELSKSNKRAKKILESIQDAFFSLDNERNFTYMNKVCEKLFLTNTEQLIGKSIEKVFPKNLHIGFYEKLNAVINQNETLYFKEYFNSVNKWYSISAYPSEDGIAVYFKDITKEKIIEEKLIESELKFKTLVNSMDDMVFTLDRSRRYTGVYGKWLQKGGFKEENFLGKSFEEVFKNDDFNIHEEAAKRVLEGENVVYNWSLKNDEKQIYYQTSISPIEDGKDNIVGAVGVGRNITEQITIENELKIANEKLRSLSFIDGLTNIPNRRYFNEYIEKEWNRGKRFNKNLSILMLDIDHFKAYNDTYGHLQGDECLKTVAQTIKNTLKRSGDLVARYGGEEFAIILPETNSKGAEVIAEKIRCNIENLRLPNINSRVIPFVTVSIGITTVTSYVDMNYGEFINNADKALYKAKESGRNRIYVYLS